MGFCATLRVYVCLFREHVYISKTQTCAGVVVVVSSFFKHTSIYTIVYKYTHISVYAREQRRYNIYCAYWRVRAPSSCCSARRASLATFRSRNPSFCERASETKKNGRRLSPPPLRTDTDYTLCTILCACSRLRGICARQQQQQQQSYEQNVPASLIEQTYLRCAARTRSSVFCQTSQRYYCLILQHVCMCTQTHTHRHGVLACRALKAELCALLVVARYSNLVHANYIYRRALELYQLYAHNKRACLQACKSRTHPRRLALHVLPAGL